MCLRLARCGFARAGGICPNRWRRKDGVEYVNHACFLAPQTKPCAIQRSAEMLAQLLFRPFCSARQIYFFVHCKMHYTYAKADRTFLWWKVQMTFSFLLCSQWNLKQQTAITETAAITVMTITMTKMMITFLIPVSYVWNRQLKFENSKLLFVISEFPTCFFLSVWLDCSYLLNTCQTLLERRFKNGLTVKPLLRLFLVQCV